MGKYTSLCICAAHCTPHIVDDYHQQHQAAATYIGKVFLKSVVLIHLGGFKVNCANWNSFNFQFVLEKITEFKNLTRMYFLIVSHFVFPLFLIYLTVLSIPTQVLSLL